MFNAEYSRQAKRFLKKAEKIIAGRILQKIENLQSDPLPSDAKQIEGYREKLFRVRVGDYRILYDVDHARKIVGIVRVDKRSRVYGRGA